KSLSTRLRERSEVDRGNVPLRHVRSRRRTDHRPGGLPRGALPYCRRSAAARARLRAVGPGAECPLALGRPRAHSRPEDGGVPGLERTSFAPPQMGTRYISTKMAKKSLLPFLILGAGFAWMALCE